MTGGFCETCREKGLGRERRPTAAQRGYGSRWQKASKAFLDEHPLCVGYPADVHGERAVGAQCVDHIVPHKGDMERFWDAANWQALCIPCNSRKAVEIEGAGQRRA